MTIEAMKLALEYVESVSDDRYNAEHIDREALVTALRQAIEQAEQAQPVAYGMPDTQIGRNHRMMMVRLDKGQDGCTVPLYTAPPPRQPWVGLTDEEYVHITDTVLHQGRGLVAYYIAIEAKLKEKNT